MHACRWIDDAPQDLGTLGGEFSEALGVNEAGVIVGWAWDAGRRQRGFMWTEAGGMVELVIPDSETFIARSINNLDQVVGTYRFVDDNDVVQSHAVLWDHGVVTDLGRPEGVMTEEVISIGGGAINDAGQVVGNFFKFPELTGGAFLWEDGVMRDLSTLIDDEGWTIGDAAAINNAGAIAATASHTDGRRRAVILTPIGNACAADFDDSGGVDSADFFAFIAVFFGGLPAADFDDSGAIDSADFFAFIAAFFEGC